MKPFVVALAIPIFTLPSHAHYKCVINDKSVYADEPCATDAKQVGAPQDRVNAQANFDANMLRQQERMRRSQIEQRETIEFAEQQRAAQRYIAAEKRQTAMADRTRQRR